MGGPPVRIPGGSGGTRGAKRISGPTHLPDDMTVYNWDDIESLRQIGILPPKWIEQQQRELDRHYERVLRLKSKVVEVALAQWKLWHGDTNLTESMREGRKKVKKYWKEGVGRKITNSQATTLPWSAAFIDWVMKEAGAGSDFKYAWKHATYIHFAKQNRLKNQGVFRAYPVSGSDRVSPEKGDLICNARAGNTVTYDTIKDSGYTHCDIVVERKQSEITVIGGNVDNIKVGKKFVPLTSSGHLEESTTYKNEDGDEKPVRYFAIIKIEP